MSHLTVQFIAIADRIGKIEKRLDALEARRGPEHGSSGYTRGCRCDICKEARKIQMRKYRKRNTP